MNIPWKLKSAAFAAINILGDTPLYYAQRYFGRGEHVPVSPSWAFHMENLKRFSVENSIEFGAGKHLGMALFLSQLKHHQIAVDLFRQLDLSLVNKAIDSIPDIPKNGNVQNTEDILKFYNIEYLAPLDASETSLASDSLDACVSTNTLEHIPTNVISAIWKEMYRVLKPGGIVSAKIDYSDHYSHTDKAISKLNFLLYSESDWEKYNHGNHYQNRLRHQHHLDLLKQAGISILSESVQHKVAPPTGMINERLLTGMESDFYLDGFIVAQK